GQWSVPHYNGLPYLDKPVLLFWMIAAAFRALGVSELAARLPSALGALATVLFTYDLVRVLAGRRRALLAATVLATAPIVLAYARLVIFDMPLTALVTAALDCLVRARTEGNAWRWLPLAGLAMGLATLTKGPVGIAVPLLAWFAGRGALARPARRRGAGRRAAPTPRWSPSPSAPRACWSCSSLARRRSGRTTSCPRSCRSRSWPRSASRPSRSGRWWWCALSGAGRRSREPPRWWPRS